MRDEKLDAYGPAGGGAAVTGTRRSWSIINVSEVNGAGRKRLEAKNIASR